VAAVTSPDVRIGAKWWVPVESITSRATRAAVADDVVKRNWVGAFVNDTYDASDAARIDAPNTSV
jgi:hypothetical protein